MLKVHIALTPILLLAFAATPSYSIDADEPEFYYLYGNAIPGTKFKNRLFTSRVPLDRSYRELSDRHKQLIRDDYHAMPESETPPYPKYGRGPLFKSILSPLRYSKVSGYLRLIAMINESGQVSEVSVDSSPSEKVTKHAIKVLNQTEFDPATCSGQPCNMEFLLEVEIKYDPKPGW